MLRPDTKFLLQAIFGIVMIALAVVLLCLLPGFMMDSGRRACMRWLRSPTNQASLRECALELLKKYPAGSVEIEGVFLTQDRVPELVRRIPPPASGWGVQIVHGDGAASGHVRPVSLGGFESYCFHVGDSNLVIEGATKISPGFYLSRSSDAARIPKFH